MADPNKDIAKSIGSVLTPVSQFFRSRMGVINKALLGALSATAIQGTALRQVNEKIQEMSAAMISQVAGEQFIKENLKDFLKESLVQEAIEDLTREAWQDDLANALQNFGNNPVPEEDQIIPETALENLVNDAAENPKTVTTEAPASPDPEISNPLNQENQPIIKSPAQTSAPDTTPTKQEQTNASNNQNPGIPAENPLPTAPPPDELGEQEDEDMGSPDADKTEQTEESPAQNQNTTKAPIKKADEASAVQPTVKTTPPQPEEATPTTAPEPIQEKPNDEESKPNENPEQATTPETSPPLTPPPIPEELPETPEVSPSSGTEGPPLVNTDEYGQVVKPAEKNQVNPQTGQPNNQNTEQANGGQPNQPGAGGQAPGAAPDAQAAEQNTPNRGKLTQGINYLRQKGAVDKIAKQILKLIAEKNKEQRNLKKLNDELRPLKLQKNLLRTAYWGLVIITWIIRGAAAILAMTIIFLIFIPLAPAVWMSANIPSFAADAIDIRLAMVKEKMEEKEKKQEEKKTTVKKLNEQISKLSRDRQKILNQSLLGNKQS